MAQLDHLRKHLKAGRTISPLEAIGLYGMFRLAARIKELRYKGWDIETEIRKDPNGNSYAVYWLNQGNDHGLPSFADAESRKPA